jgi:hypothetical protein
MGQAFELTSIFFEKMLKCAHFLKPFLFKTIFFKPGLHFTLVITMLVLCASLKYNLNQQYPRKSHISFFIFRHTRLVQFVIDTQKIQAFILELLSHKFVMAGSTVPYSLYLSIYPSVRPLVRRHPVYIYMETTRKFFITYHYCLKENVILLGKGRRRRCWKKETERLV